MTADAVIVLIILVTAIVLFVTEYLSVDLVAVLILLSLTFTGVITAQESVEGFSNSATVTVAAMFVLSAALLKTGALQMVSIQLAALFQRNYKLGLMVMMVTIATVSAFINNTPVVAVMIPIAIQVARAANVPPSKLLMPVSFASIFGGTCTLLGTSTNVVVSGVMEKSGLGPMDMFQMTPMGLIFLAVGILFMMSVGYRLLPHRNSSENLNEKFGIQDYVTEIELLEGAPSVGKRIMDSPLIKELGMDVIEVNRDGNAFVLPQGDMMLQSHDRLKVRCDVEKIKSLKDKEQFANRPTMTIGEDGLTLRDMALVEIVIPNGSEFEGKTLKQLDFRRSFRAIPLAIKHREEVIHANLYQVELQAGDILLAEVKKHHIPNLKKQFGGSKPPFILLSENGLTDFDKRKFIITLVTLVGVFTVATLNLLPIMSCAIAGAVVLVLMRCIRLDEVYEAIEWKVIFLLAGALSLGVAMEKSGLANVIAHSLVSNLGQWGPIAIVSGLYLVTSLLTEVMSNNATAALLAPIAIVTAQSLGLSPIPFLMAITFAASASFMTPVGYQTNTMIYSAGQYKFLDFIKVGSWLNLLFWILATILIPMIFPF
ncbi:SLC13 family permease [Catalinimonas niigatensis]|uniref:SLC13 family permease n=1 Tax=Catalinimonas niigatensis TaxID=1397264 RepID=UPI002665C2FC|nr:SLC13 family permease [Catalinimonas niigatensis]WPP50368.1 SLC13 family permease [Catalinimonas niigatensis]